MVRSQPFGHTLSSSLMIPKSLESTLPVSSSSLSSELDEDSDSESESPVVSFGGLYLHLNGLIIKGNI